MLKEALADAHRGKFDVFVVWALDRISREGIEDLLRTVRKFREAGCAVVSVQEPWCNDGGDTQQLLLPITGWVGKFEAKRKGDCMRIGHAERRAAGLHTGRTVGAGQAQRLPGDAGGRGQAPGVGAYGQGRGGVMTGHRHPCARPPT